MSVEVTRITGRVSIPDEFDRWRSIDRRPRSRGHLEGARRRAPSPPAESPPPTTVAVGLAGHDVAASSSFISSRSTLLRLRVREIREIGESHAARDEPRVFRRASRARRREAMHGHAAARRPRQRIVRRFRQHGTPRDGFGKRAKDTVGRTSRSASSRSAPRERIRRGIRRAVDASSKPSVTFPPSPSVRTSRSARPRATAPATSPLASAKLSTDRADAKRPSAPRDARACPTWRASRRDRRRRRAAPGNVSEDPKAFGDVRREDRTRRTDARARRTAWARTRDVESPPRVFRRPPRRSTGRARRRATRTPRPTRAAQPTTVIRRRRARVTRNPREPSRATRASRHTASRGGSPPRRRPREETRKIRAKDPRRRVPTSARATRPAPRRRIFFRRRVRMMIRACARVRMLRGVLAPVSHATNLPIPLRLEDWERS